MMSDRIRVGWIARDAPLVARAVAAVGDPARALADRLAALDDAALGALAAVAGDDVLVVLGAAAALPWVDGVVYLGRDDAAPELLLPTALAPTVPPGVLAAAIRAALPRPAPIAVLAAPARLVPCGIARAIDRGRLAAWREAR
ncbi:MAG TPA: hypothetical protein VHW23_43805 [Kofleriaceae bacterium]|jgi:hypothetical protein|nr:hypothetical protein [Kofleriaceae bacterium]